MYEFLLVLHLLGVVLGAGAAITSDVLFFAALRDGYLAKPEMNLLRQAGRVVWAGVGILILSGIILLILSNFVFLQDAHFQAKMLLVAIIVINGGIIHAYHLPFLQKSLASVDIEKDLARSRDHWGRMRLMFASGAVSMVSWLGVLVLASLRGMSLDLLSIVLLYVFSIGFSVLISQFFLFHMFPKHPKNKAKKHALARGAWPYAVVLCLSALIVVLLFFAGKKLTDNNYTDTTINLTPAAELAIDEGLHVSYAPTVPPASGYKDQRFFEVQLEVLEGVCPLDPENGVTFDVWGYRIAGDDEVYCGAPGPVLRGRVGDIARITLTNLASNTHPHNIDFHAVTGQGGGARDLIVAPGETASIDVRLLYPGTFMYHCAYGDVPVHISHGMYGMFIVDPAKPLPSVEHEWAVMQSEWYVTEPNAQGLTRMDRQALSDETPRYVTFNGRTDALLGENMLEMNVGERARIYFVNEGLNLTSNFHPIGSHWDIVYPEGATHPANTVIHGSQSTSVVAGGGTVVELVAQVPSNIILVDHALSRTFYKGAKGIIKVSGPENPEIFRIHQAAQAMDEEAPETQNAEKVNVTIPRGAASPSMADRAYQPNAVTIKKGTTVTWTNVDNVMHTVTSGESDGEIGVADGVFDSGFMRKGKTFSYTFDEAGTFPYYCAPHPWATGVVIVEE